MAASLGDSLLGKALSCGVSVVKAERSMKGDSVRYQLSNGANYRMVLIIEQKNMEKFTRAYSCQCLPQLEGI